MSVPLHEIGRLNVESPDGSYATTIILSQEEVAVASRTTPGAVVRTIKVARTIEDFPATPVGSTEFQVDHPTMGRLIVRVTADA